MVSNKVEFPILTMSSSMSLAAVAIVLTLMFFISGVDKVMHFNKVVVGFEKRFPVEMPRFFAQVAIVIAIVVELVAPCALIYAATKTGPARTTGPAITTGPSTKPNTPLTWTKHLGGVAALSLAIFTVAATLIYHFPPFGHQYYPFMSNLTTVGGLLLMVWIFYYL